MAQKGPPSWSLPSLELASQSHWKPAVEALGDDGGIPKPILKNDGFIWL